MIPPIDAEKLIRRTRRYELSDGFREFQLALMFIQYGVICWLTFSSVWWAFIFRLKENYGSWSTWMASLLLLASPAIVALMTHCLMAFTRERWLWRASGVVKPAKSLIPTRLTMLVGFAAFAAILLGMALHEREMIEDSFLWRIIWAVSGWSTGSIMLALGRSYDLARYVWSGVLLLLLSTGLLALPLGFGETGLVFGFSLGTVLAITGTVALRRALSDLDRE